ncbi:MarC family protein [Candidatus Karelsulcia muelleri]|uniref:UPF0056 membrane protein n=1 Tax=Candidatus Karelsulcia muelleri PSPU TaxID=1189303 RepID=A0AAD1AYP7_9FLAO|nr:MarC family protein [Candidatus Karelsulcia muelleri]NJJ98867.1 MarC family protein [Candidatus Karelsulcia muelleri]BAO66224.1 MarC family integral membrane protein [Candidatus Karelsulcia muelleri PSPU]
MEHIKLFFTCFFIIFSIIDIIGNAPIIIGYLKTGFKINVNQIIFLSSGIFLFFLFLGDYIFNIFGIDIYSFSLAGSIILFLISLEMILGINFNKIQKSAQISIIPISFPLIAGPGSVTTLISLTENYEIKIILLSLIINLIIVYFVLKHISFIEKKINNEYLNIFKILFGIILLSFSIKLFVRNICYIFNSENILNLIKT